MKTISRFTITVLAFVALSCTVLAQDPIRKLQMATYAITNMYVDSVDENKMVETAIKAMLKELDPHSDYLSPKEVKKFNESMSGNFNGIGIQFNMTNDTLFVIQTITDAPAEKAGIMAGDKIISVNDTIIAGKNMSTDIIMTKIKGKKGTKVNVGVVRRGVDGVMQFSMKRDKIPVNSINAYFMLDKKTGYIRIEQFGATTYDEFMKAMKELKAKGMEDLVLDLQGNGGGYLMAAAKIINEFLNNDDMIVYTEGLNVKRQELKAQGNGKYRKERLVVLTDDYSASASEILSGAIQDHDRGVIVGRRTFGKGLVQQILDLPDGSMIKLTTSRYYIPSGRLIQKPYGDGKDYEKDLINRYNHGEMSNADSIHFPDSLKYKTLRLGRTVYGGGGIMPDYFVPLDTTKFTKLHKELAFKGVLNSAVTQYIDLNREKLQKKYKDFEAYERKFKVGDEIMDIIKKEADKNKIEYNDSTLNESLPQISLQIKALVARDLWSLNEYLKIMNNSDEVVKTALRILNDGTYEAILTKKEN